MNSSSLIIPTLERGLFEQSLRSTGLTGGSYSLTATDAEVGFAGKDTSTVVKMS